MGWRDRVFMLAIILLGAAQAAVAVGTPWIHLGVIVGGSTLGCWIWLEVRWFREKEGGEWK